MTVDQAITEYKRDLAAADLAAEAAMQDLLDNGAQPGSLELVNCYMPAAELQTRFSAYIKTLEEDSDDYNKALHAFVESL